jgi:hypothetical protein
MSMNPTDIQVTRQGPVTIVTIDRQQARNAVDRLNGPCLWVHLCRSLRPPTYKFRCLVGRHSQSPTMFKTTAPA